MDSNNLSEAYKTVKNQLGLLFGKFDYFGPLCAILDHFVPFWTTFVNQIMYKFFEKLADRHICLQSDTALAQNSMV